MDGENEKSVVRYCTYNGMARCALIAGIPITPLIICLALMLVTGFGGIVFLGLKGAIFPLIIAGVLLFIRVKCDGNSKAIESMMWDIKGLFLRIVCQSKIVSFGGSRTNCNRRKKQDVTNWFKDNAAGK